MQYCLMYFKYSHLPSSTNKDPEFHAQMCVLKSKECGSFFGTK